MSSRWGRAIVLETVRGFPCRVYADRPRDLATLLADTVAFADRRALVQGDHVVTFAELGRLVDVAAATLVGRGVAPGDRVLLLGRNSIEWVVTLWAIWRVGAIAAVANASWGPGQVSHAVDLVDPVLVAPVENCRQGVSRPGVSSAQCGGVRSEDDPGLLVFTSGTTGAPKAATLSHRAVIANVQALLDAGGRLPGSDPAARPATVTLISVPLFHIGGLQQVLTAALSGGCLVFDDGHFDARQTLQVIERERVGVWAAVPTMVTRVLAAHRDEDLSSVRSVTMGGAQVSAGLRERVRAAFPSVRRGAGVSYGLTEAGGVVAAGVGPELEVRPGAVGRPTPLADLRIGDPDAAGVGEILVRSAAVMTGYWGSSESPVDADGWLSTGDRGHVDDEGYLYVTGRAKDVVIRAGENVACPRVEAVLAGHPAVAEVAVLGLPDPDLGERVAAVVVPRADVTENELRSFAHSALARFEVPTSWWLRSAPLPTNAAGKVVKSELVREWSERLQVK